MRSVMPSQERFSRIQIPRINRSTFDRSHGWKGANDSGYLIPFFLDEAIPGDTFSIKPTVFSRMSTPLKPIMDNIFCDIQFFSVPYRLVWDNFQKFMGEQTDPGDSTDFVIPTVDFATTGECVAGSFYDAVGIPINVADTDTNGISALPWRAYNLIWNEWYRDQDLQVSRTVAKDDGPDTVIGGGTFIRRNKRKDYFTSARPWPQKGDAVTIPMQNVPVLGIGKLNQTFNTNSGSFYETGGTSTTTYLKSERISDNAADSEHFYIEEDPNNTGYPGVFADMSQAQLTINLLRQSATLQQLFERDARGGTRYTEIINSHFGVISPDARLQRPELLFMSSAPVTMDPIPQTSGNTSDITPQANLAATATAAQSGKGFVKTFTEHEIVIGLLSFRADINYQQGINKMFTRSTRYDFFWPSFAHLGEQSILNKELFVQGTTADDDVFGYQERYAEYRYKPSVITGAMRSDFATSLDVWHLAQDFSALPGLNSNFIEEIPPIDRVIATPDEPQFIIDAFFDFKATRPIPVYGTPGIGRI